MTDIDTAPRTREWDSAPGFLLDGYRFGQRRFEKLGRPVFRARILGRPVVVMRGADAAGFFYRGDHFGRDRAMPTSVVHLLQDEGSVQSLTGHPHFHRKSMFVSLLASDDAIERVTSIFSDEYRRAQRAWPNRVVLHDELWPILTRTGLRWVGLPLESADADDLAHRLRAMVDNAGSFGPPNWRARQLRAGAEDWAAHTVERVRDGSLAVSDDSVVAALARHRDSEGSLLSPEEAAVELLNVLRPLGAVSRFIMFEAHALAVRPAVRDALAHGSLDPQSFVHEVRRYYPFFPVIGGTALKPFTYEGLDIERGDWVLLDLFGTNRDPSIWDDPEQFVPERFDGWVGDPNTLIPQGGGDVVAGHRCPGERATIEIMIAAARLLIDSPEWTTPRQDLRISLRRFPALPESGMVLERS